MKACLYAVVFCVVTPGIADDRAATSQSRLQIAPDRNYDLLHIALELNVDYEHRAFQGDVVNTLAPLSEALTLVRFHADKTLLIDGCEAPLIDPSPGQPTLSRAFSDIAHEVKDSPRMSPGYRNYVIPGGSADVTNWLKELKTVTYLAGEDVAANGLERRGARVSRVWHGKLVTGQRTVFLSFYLTQDGRATDLDSYFE